ncbi:MAG: energy transducer TonB [Saprospiraceae bacterium]
MKFYVSFIFTFLTFQIGMAQETADSIPNDTIYKFVEQMPVFGNCTDLLGEDERNACSHNQLMLYVLGKLPLAENITVNNIEIGETIVRFVIDENGDVQNVRLIKGIDKEFDKMYTEIFRTMPQWQAGEKSEKSVKVEMTLPMKVHF